MKTYTTLSKRFRITRRGKVMIKKGGQNHFNAREPGKVTRLKRAPQHLSKSFHRIVKESMPF